MSFYTKNDINYIGKLVDECLIHLQQLDWPCVVYCQVIVIGDCFLKRPGGFNTKVLPQNLSGFCI